MIDELVTRARAGDRAALDALVRAIKDDLYGLSIRMLWHPEDAEDATQEILVKIVTHLSEFRGESSFRTWTWRIATNHLLRTRAARAERMGLSFDAFGRHLAEGAEDPGARPDVRALEEEVKIGCTQAMLLCLDRDDRVAFVLGAVFELDDAGAAAILDIEPAAFRKRLSRARERLRAFMEGHCGLVNPERPCRCSRRIAPAIKAGHVDPGRLLFAGHPALGAAYADMETLHNEAAVFKTHPRYAAPERVAIRIKEILESGGFGVLA
jgi:RNA polymerase sigma factor (sigma-70 family)